MEFACSVDSDGFHLHVSAHQGSYPAWWKEISAEIYGWNPKAKQVVVNGRSMNGGIVKYLPHGMNVVFADNGKGEDLQLR
jgi:hypothetical protein